jgi:hypothetical protein
MLSLRAVVATLLLLFGSRAFPQATPKYGDYQARAEQQQRTDSFLDALGAGDADGATILRAYRQARIRVCGDDPTVEELVAYARTAEYNNLLASRMVRLDPKYGQRLKLICPAGR